MDYIVLSSTSRTRLAEDVVTWMKMGYKPQGSVAVTPDTMLSSGSYSQAMIKEDE